MRFPDKLGTILPMLIDRVIVGNMFTNSYIISTGKKECVVVDPGASSRLIVQRLEAMNLTPQAILLTHGHIDHTSAANMIQKHYEGRGHYVSVGVHDNDARFLGDTATDANRGVFERFGDAGLSAFEHFETAVPDPDFFFGDGEFVLESDLAVMHTPGHTSGSVCFYSEEREALFSGDTLFFNSIGRTDVPSGDADVLLDSIKNRLFELPPQTRVFPGHGPTSLLERELKNNPLLSDGATI